MRARCALVAVSALAGLLCAGQAANAAAEPSYVALGDSYTAGWGVMPAASGAPPDCGQSAVDYPHLAAAALGLSLKDVSCRGATTEDMIVAQSADQAPQFDALTPSTNYVSLSIGGNDENLFGTVAEGCDEIDAGRVNAGDPCGEALEGFVAGSLEVVAAEEELALEYIHELSPHARIFVVGYPEVTPSSGYCPGGIPWNTGDLAWFRSDLEVRLNDLVRREALHQHDLFVNTFLPEGHTACEAADKRWIEPLFGSLTGIGLHPNAVGEAHVAYDLERAMINAGVR
jgi:hypothetical protein